ncbi:autotransporter-associated beta strand repeat-containing protein [Sphingopyxis sp. CCNWLW253]|uniref:autotransporter-associated beta strand repeat-containing protein n=1 Tax=unclassified Sphingopyxis TaxID=2614943 RepID=UPI003013078F
MTIDRVSAACPRKAQPLSRRLLCGASLAAVLACTPLSARAEDRYWDANGTAVGSGGTGTWNLANLNWSPNGDGVSGPFAEPWNNGDLDNAIFGSTAGTVTVGVPVTVGNITFSSAGYVLNGGTLTLGGPAPTIATNFSNGNAAINSTIAGSSGLIKAGGGGLVLNGTNSFTGGIAINSGSLYASSDAALGALSNNIVTAAGVTVRLSIGGASTSRAVAIGDGGTLILEGAGAGSALISGNGNVRVAASGVTMSNDLSSYTGQTIFTGCNGTCSARFTSLRNLGEASALGAPVTVADGTIIYNQQSQYSDSLIYLGDGDSSNRNWDINGNNAVIRNQGTGTLSITGNIDVSAGATFVADTASMELLGVLSGGAYGFNGVAGNTVTLGNANTFTGQGTVAGLVKASVLADTGSVSSLGAGSTIGLSIGALSYVGAGSSSNRNWVVHGTSGIQNDGTGALDLSGNMSFVAGGIADSLTLGGSFAGENRLSGVISGAGNLVANGSGSWVVGGANNFTGNVTVTSGTLKMGNAAAFGPTNGLIVNGGTLDLGGFDLVAPSLTGTGGTVALGAQTLTVDAKTAQVFGGSITGTGGLRKSGAGSLTLTGTNSYTGATTIGGGRLTLDFSGAGGAVNDIVSGSSPLGLSGGTLEVTGAAGEINGQSFNGLTVNAGSNTVRAVSGAGGIVNLNLGAITRAGGLVNFVLPASGAITTSNTDGVLGGWATINGSDYAKVVSGGIIAFDASDYTTKDDAATWANGDIISDTANAADTPFFGTVTGDVQLGGLRYTAATGSTVAIGAANTLGIDGTIIVAPSTLATNQSITGGSLTGSTGGGTLGVQHNGTGMLTIGSTIVNNGGATGFAKSGGGTVRLTGTNSYTGGTTLSGGRLEVTQLANGGTMSSIGASNADAANLVIESGTLAYTGGVDAVTDRGISLVNGGGERAIQVDTGRTVEFSGLVTSPDDAGLTKTGGGTLVLSNAANDYVGVTTITQTGAGSSTLSISTLSDGGVASGIGAASADSANLVISNGARLQYTGGTVAIDRGFTLAAGQGGIDVANAGTTLTVGGIATGAGAFFKDGTGTLILSGTNSYVGDTTVNAGILRAGSARAFGAGGRFMTVNSGATLDLGGFNISAAAVIGGGLIDLGGRTLTTGGGGGIFTGRITGTGGYTRTGGFTQTLSGCNNDYTGVTTIGGTLSIDCIANGGQVSGIGASSAASSNLAFANGTLVYTGASVSTDRGFAMTGNGNLNVFDAATTLEFSGNITGAGQLNKDGAGTLLLSGVNNTTGNLRVITGTVRAGSTTALRSGWVSLDDRAGVLLDLDGYNNNVLYLTGGGTAGGNIALDAATLTITDGGSASAVFGGAISGSGGLIKNGNGFQQLSGCASSYGGTTVINGGTLAVDCLGDGGANSSIGSSSSAANNLLLSGGTLRYVGTGGATNRQFTLGASTASKLDASGTGAIAFNHAGPLTFASANTAQTLTLGGTSTANNILAAQITNNGTGATRLTKTDAGTWILTNPGSTYTGITTISGGVLGVDKLADGGIASSIGASSAAAANLVIGNGSTLRYTGAGDSTNRLFTLSQGVTFIESSGTGAIVFTDTGPVTLANINQARTIALGGTNTGNNTLAGSIGNAGTGVTTLAKNDSGNWVLTGNHSYTGSTNVNGGTLFVGGGGTTGSIASAIVNNFGTLGFNRSDLLSYGGQIGGTGSVRQAGTGTTVLTGTNLYTGGTTIDAGTLQLGNGGTTGSIVGNVVDNGLLVFNRSNLYTFAGTISGSGAVRQIGSGTTVLSGINSYAGGTSILGGTLQVSADANLGAAAGGLDFSGGTLRTTASFASARNSSLTGAGTILTDTGTTFLLNGLISGAGGLTKSGAGILTLTGANSYSGATAVNAGTLLVNGNQSAATGLFTVASGATLGGSGTIGGSVTVLSGGILAPGNSPGTLNINGDLALAGGSVLNFEFGQADVAGGPLNDLINVGGDLTLDGTLNVNVSAGGNFGGGLYRVFNYGGALIDNGLALGSMPPGSNVTVQTSVAGQVNLINSDGLSLSFWDGAVGPKFNGAVDGGSGTWHLGGGDNNWTGADGSINAAFADGTFAIFAGAPGTVTVDNGGGAVAATGMQFAADGYVIDGAPLALVGPESLIRVGDGTAAGAGFTATISASLTGASQLVKTDAGTLVLTGANSYTGGTLISGGVVSVENDSFLGNAAGAVTLDGGTLRMTGANAASVHIYNLGTNGGAIDIANAATANGVLNAMTGSGGLTKLGAGSLALAADNSYTGGTTIAAGTLQIGSNSGTTGSIVGDVVNNGRFVIFRSNAYTYAGSITGTGSVSMTGTGVTTLTGNSNYGGGTAINGLGGELRIAGGANVFSGGSTTMGRSTLTVDGANTVFSTTAVGGGNIPFAGSTIVNVTDGGTLRIRASDLDLRTVSASTQVNITGANSLADIAGGIRGSTSFNAPFSLTVGAGGTLRTRSVSQIGMASSTTNPIAVAITGGGSNWTSNGSLLMTAGDFTVDQGGAASFASAVFGAAPQDANLLVSGAGSSFATTGDLVIGSGTGTGALTVTDGAQVTAGGVLTIAQDAGSNGTVTIGDGGVVRVGGGTLAMGPGNAVLYIGDFQSLPVGKRAGILDAAELTFAAATNMVNFNHIDSDYVFATRMSGTGEIISSRGTTILTADNAHSGQTHINGGMIIVNGNQSAATGRISVMAGGALGGRGVIGGAVEVFGRIAPGDLGAAPGTLTINGDLFTSFSANLDYNFGQANVVGGAFNDLIEVGGNLTLDGTLNVTVSPGGSFDPGVYRVINYAGVLTNNGLDVDPAYFVQTSVANQVNLVNTTGLTMRFWDGVAGAKNDGAITGGDGLWQASGGNDNWTEFDGSANAPFTDEAFAVFSGQPGTVTVNASLGTVTASGMQFASDGYVIGGDPIVLTGVQSVIRVGDGTAAGAGYTATIDSMLAGASQLVKSDLGTLVLTGANTYSGGTAINAGTLQISADSNLGDLGGGLSFDGGTLHSTADMTSGRAVDLVSTGRFLTDAGTTLTMNGAFSGSGSLVKTGAGTLALRGSSGFAGNATVNDGRLSITNGGSVSNFRGFIGNVAGQTGEVAVSGPGSSWTNANHIYVGYSGTGLLTIENGASVSNVDGFVGVDAGSTGIVTVSGAGSTWTSSDNLRVGVGGEGSLTVNAGAKVINLFGSFGVGADVGSRGSVIASGAGSTIAARAMFVGNYGNGELTIANGAQVVSSDFSAIGDVAGSQGVINIGAAAGQGPAAAGALNTPMLTFGEGDGTLVFNHTDTGYLFSAGLDSQGAGAHAIQQLAGTTILNGDGSGFTGTTTVSGGALLVGDQSGVGSLGGAVNVALGGTLGGAGTIGGNVAIADGGALAAGVNGAGTLTINGGLSLAGGAALNFEFGQANVAGGALNDLVDVSGDLVLDGTINVTVPAGGNFGPGVYRVFNYGGALTDNGLAIGTMPAGADVFVQTAVANQVNLINTDGAMLNFWDGSAGTNKFNNAVDGGGGMWRTALDNSWTEATGAVNAGYDNGAFAIFAGTGGLVTIDNSLGTVTASGLQFATTNYRIQGDALTLTGPQSVIRVGDGTTAGLGYIAIISSEITGSAQLVKTDVGRLELTGTNSYTGGTAFNGGTIRVASDANLGAASGGLSFNGGTLNTTADLTSARAVDLVGQGAFSTEAGTTLTLTGNLTGAGLIGKLGAGTLVLAGTGSQTGGIGVADGALFVNGDYGAATGRVTMNQLTTLGGTGIIGGDVTLAGTLAPGVGGAGTLTINGDLTISPTATLAYEFGEAGVVGGALNDLVNVGGDLVLDGVLNVGVPAGGAFDIGIYRMFNYGGALTDNGVTLGTIPAGANAVVQTSVAGQVNLVNSAGLALNFWDGAAGPKNNGAINGGNGVWQANGGNDNWTGEDGAANAGYADGAFAIFGGTGGTVTVDNSLGAVSVVGMQFAANNYVITGGGIELTDATATIRVGDGSTAGAGFTATINSALGGAAQLVKSDAGTLILGGTNSYAGGTLITGGVLRISSDANLGAASGDVTLDGGTLETSASVSSARDIVVASSGAISAAADTVFTYNGLFSGTGTLTKNGAGTLLVTADNSGFGGSTAVAGGMLAVQGSLGGTVNVGSAGRLEGDGRVGSIVNAGVVAPGRSIGTLTVAGDYNGNGGALEIEAELGGDASPADRLVVNGATSGNTRVTIINRGGLGAQTVEGIKIVDVAGASNGSFTLDGDYLFDGQQAVIAGAYGYRLFKNGVATPQDGDWYLRSARLDAIGEPEGPLYQPGVPVYEAYVGALQSLNRLPTLQQRVGNRSWAASPIAGAGLWGRFESERQRPEALVSTSGADRKVDQWQAQLGLDAVLAARRDSAALVGGLTAHYGKADSAVTSIFGDGTIDTQGYGVGATMTWYGPKGFYVDGQVKLSWFDSDLESNVLGSLARGNKGDGQAFSLELGKQTQLGRNLSITPQIQMSYAKVDFHRFADPAEAAVSAAKGESLKTRWGLAIDHQTSWKGRSGDTRRTRLYTVMNLSYEWLDGAEADVSGTPIANRDRRLTGELGLGGSYSWGDDRFTLYTEVSGDTAIADFGAGYNVKGTAGFRVRF